MNYVSTRDSRKRLGAAEAIQLGLSREGGLFVPESLPAVSAAEIEALRPLSYEERAVRIMKLFLEDYTEEELRDYARRAYAGFDCAAVAPTRRVNPSTWFLELWHGPTCAFKDMALQMLPYLLTAALKKTGEEKKVCILVATSGDTGKAALEGFRDVPGTGITVFYPRDGVSEVQKLQMTSQEGENVNVCAVEGNFDDAQTGVKAIFSDPALREELAGKGWFLSSANSINWGRLLPQIVYYFSAYCDLLNAGAVQPGEKVNFCVPTGNFGDILAGWYAKKMGLPVAKLLCASNKNAVLTEFIRTGRYDRKRAFYETISPSMDILVSSNLERLLYHLSGSDAETARLMGALSAAGEYRIAPALLEKIRADFAAECASDEETCATIARAFREEGYLMDTHTAVAYTALGKYRSATGDDALTVVVSTASPFKFTEAVLSALGVETAEKGPALIGRLAEETGVPAPQPLAALAGKTPRFTKALPKEQMTDEVRAFLR
ncbi:MAG: threonine synthase [bacterium]